MNLSLSHHGRHSKWKYFCVYIKLIWCIFDASVELHTVFTAGTFSLIEIESNLSEFLLQTHPESTWQWPISPLVLFTRRVGSHHQNLLWAPRRPAASVCWLGKKSISMTVKERSVGEGVRVCWCSLIFEGSADSRPDRECLLNRLKTVLRRSVCSNLFLYLRL